MNKSRLALPASSLAAVVAATLGLGVAVVALIAACGSRSELDAPVQTCSTPATSYCEANGCPLTGPEASTPSAVSTWCGEWSSFAPRVTGYGTCTTPDGHLWALDVKTSGADGGVYLLYGADGGSLVSVSTLTGASADGGTVEENYGTCASQLGLVSCQSVIFSCTR